MKKLFFIYKYFLYHLKAVNEHGVHSPFVFDLLTKVIYNRADYYSFKKIENLREELLDSKRTILKHIANSPKYDQLVFRLVNYFQPLHILEFGTSFGINTAYMASANSKTRVITIEGSKEIAEIAKDNFEKLELKNIELFSDKIDTCLPGIIAKIEPVDFVYFGGNHNKKYTLYRFSRCLEKVNGGSVFVFDNIYRSPEMNQAWIEIKNNNKVTVTIDLFYLGIVFFRQEQVKQHFVIKF